MTMLCVCGHGLDTHDGGRCTGESIDSEYGVFRCMCFSFRREIE